MDRLIIPATLIALVGWQRNAAKQERVPLPYTKKQFAAEVEYELQLYLRKGLDLPDATPLYACLRDGIDLNEIPASYLKQCSEFKKLSINHK